MHRDETSAARTALPAVAPDAGAPTGPGLMGRPGLAAMAAPVAPGAQALFRFWQDSRLDSAGLPANLPERDAFSFDALKRIGVLGQEFVIEPIDGGRDWRYRLVGAEIVWMFGRDPTGIPFTQHFKADEAALCIAFSNQVAQTRQPVFLRARFASAGHSAGLLETMSLPVWSRGRREIWLVGASFPAGE